MSTNPFAAEGHGEMNAEQRDVGGLDGGVGDFDDAGRGKRFDDAEGAQLAGIDVDGL